MTEDSGWTVVGSKKKPRKPRKEDVVVEEEEGKKDLYRDDVEPDMPSQYAKASTSKSNSAKKQQHKPVSSEKQLVELCKALVINTPNEQLAFAGLVERVHSVTGHAWNKKYK